MSRTDQKWLAFQLVLVVLILLALATVGIFPATRIIMAVFMSVMLWRKATRRFVFDFAPFIILLLSYDSLRRFADDLSPSDIHITDIIHAERMIVGGGTLPSVFVQDHLWGHFYTPVLDVITNGFYLFHFLSPLVLSLLLWTRRRQMYWAFVIALVVLSYSAFATYILFPAAPPWWATVHGYMGNEPVYLDHFVVSTEKMMSTPNPVAAVPSLHAAYPTLIALVAITAWGKKAAWVLLLPVAVAFSTVYLGHHYVVDALLGAVYASVVYGLVFLNLLRYPKLVNLLSRQAVPSPVPAPALVMDESPRQEKQSPVVSKKKITQH
jgi:membrane-associated phospholipid phosphatase